MRCARAVSCGARARGRVRERAAAAAAASSGFAKTIKPITLCTQNHVCPTLESRFVNCIMKPVIVRPSQCSMGRDWSIAKTLRAACVFARVRVRARDRRRRRSRAMSATDATCHYQEDLPSRARQECGNCGHTGSNLACCARCRSMWFCSVKCQKAYWPFHKQWCRKNDFADAVERTEPKFARWMRKHGKQAVLKDGAV